LRLDVRGGDAMKVLAFLATLLLLAPLPASAQKSSEGLGGVLGDVLGGVLGLKSGRVHGHVVITRGDTLVLRTDDNRTLAIDASATDQRIRGLLKAGDGVTVTLRQAREGESRNETLAASAIELDRASEKPKSFQRAEGTITEASRSRVVFKTREGFTMPLDVTSIAGLPALTPGAPATLYYEQGTRAGVTALWIEPRGSAPAASIDTSRSLPGDVVRLHGLVEAVTTTGFTLSTDDGRRVSVDATRSLVQSVRPGDLVTVFGRSSERVDAIIAEVVQQNK